MDYLANLAVWATGVVAFIAIVSAACRKGGARFGGKRYREVVTYNPPGALMTVLGRALPSLLRLLVVLAVVAVVAVLAALIT